MIRHILFWKYTDTVKAEHKEAEALAFLQKSVATMVGHIDGLLCAEINTNTAGGEYDLVSEKEKPLCRRQRFIVIFCFQNSQANNADAATIKALPASDNSISAAKGAPQSPKLLPVHSYHLAAQGKQQTRPARQAVIVNLTSALGNHLR